MIVLARAHVLITRFSFLLFIVETFVMRASATYGPFLMLLAIIDSQNSELLRCLAALPSADDEPLRRLLLVARLHTFFVAPLVDDVASAARASTMRVVDRVHHFATHFRTLPEPAALASLTVRH